jgi:hypothetical protein
MNILDEIHLLIAEATTAGTVPTRLVIPVKLRCDLGQALRRVSRDGQYPELEGMRFAGLLVEFRGDELAVM